MSAPAEANKLYQQLCALLFAPLSSSALQGNDQFDRWIHQVPKVELHAHINGSISPQLLNELISEKNKKQEEEGNGAGGSTMTMMQDSDETLMQISDPKERMGYCFGIFDTIYKVMDNLEYSSQAVEDVLCAYAAENTVYLELRTSLREMKRKATSGTKESLASREDYVQTVWDTILRVQEDGPSSAAAKRFYRIRKPWLQGMSQEEYTEMLTINLRRMTVRLLLSINRASPPSVAEETIDIALKFAATDRRSRECDAPSLKMVGIDFCGHCYKGTFQDFVPCLSRATRGGLQLSLHCGEKEDHTEIKEMLALSPARLGHLVFLSSELAQEIMEHEIPAEFCITSNMLTSGLNDCEEHHLSDWFFAPALSSTSMTEARSSGGMVPDVRSAHPLSINTDDRGVFYTSMDSELKHFATIMAHQLASRVPAEFDIEQQGIDWVLKAIVAVQRDAVAGQSFLSKEERLAVLKVFDSVLPSVERFGAS